MELYSRRCSIELGKELNSTDHDMPSLHYLGKIFSSEIFARSIELILIIPQVFDKYIGHVYIFIYKYTVS